MTMDWLCDEKNWSDYQRIMYDIADNGSKILEREDYSPRKQIAKTAIYALKNGLVSVYYLDFNDKILAGGYWRSITKLDIPIIGEVVTESLEL